jgi:CheY-like chemotaxis protein
MPTPLAKLNILLVDDDKDDCLFFKEVLEELQLQTKLTTLHNGEELMIILNKRSAELPDVIFLDLNMPRKNGYDCLLEIKASKKLKQIPVIIYSTAYERDIANLLYKNGARYYIRKPGDYPELKNIIQKALTLISENNGSRTTKENFVLTAKKNETK